MAKKCARTFSIVVEKGKKSIIEVRHLLPVGIARSVRGAARWCARSRSLCDSEPRPYKYKILAWRCGSLVLVGCDLACANCFAYG